MMTEHFRDMEHLSRCVYTRSDAARVYICTVSIHKPRGSRVYIVNIRHGPHRINNIRIVARSRADRNLLPCRRNPFTPVEFVIQRTLVSELIACMYYTTVRRFRRQNRSRITEPGLR